MFELRRKSCLTLDKFALNATILTTSIENKATATNSIVFAIFIKRTPLMHSANIFVNLKW